MRALFLCSLLCAAAPVAHAALNDLYPGDYIPAPAGQSAVVVYMYDRALEGPYANGAAGQKSRSAQTAILLGATYFDIAGLRANVAVSGGRSRQKTEDPAAMSADQVDGTTDPKISMTLWPYQNDRQGRYIAVNLAQIFGEGSYTSSASQNIGQNRGRSILSLAWAERTSELTMLEVTAEFARFGTNTDFGASGARLEQRSASAITGFFRYKINDRFTPYIGAQRNWGGETIINGVPQSDSVRSDRFYLGLRFQSSPNHIFHLRTAQDSAVQWGYGLKREWVLRWTWLPK